MKFDFNRSMSDYFEQSHNLLSGIETMIHLSDSETATGELEKDPVLTIGKMILYHYRPLIDEKDLVSPPLLITYALVNRPYMMDLQPDRSVIRALLESGIDVYLIDWGYPTMDDMYMTLEDHIEWYMDDCVEYIRKKANVAKIQLLGVCQGGTFSCIYTALHQEKILNLITLVTPIDFDIKDGILFLWGKDFSVDKMVDAFGNVPAELMNFVFMTLKPYELFIDKYVQFLSNMDDRDYLINFIRTERWIFDSPDQEGETLRRFVNDFYDDNKLMKGTFTLGGKEVSFDSITCPLLMMSARYDHLVPPDSSKPLMDLVGSKDKTYLEFDVGHVGMFISPVSKTEIAPVICDWIQKRSSKNRRKK